jgi:hypothetical protein
MPNSRHHDPHIEGKLIGGLREEITLKEHAGLLAELHDGTSHAFGPECKMRRGVERDCIEVGDIDDSV